MAVKFSLFGSARVISRNTLSFWFGKIQLEIFVSVKNRKIVNNKMQCVRIFIKQSQMSK